ncbi:hypothetical protein ACFX1R_046227 [Malus domestica]
MDSTVGNQLFSFLDTYSGNNQIAMFEPDNEKTVFVIKQGTYYYNRPQERRSYVSKVSKHDAQEADWGYHKGLLMMVEIMRTTSIYHLLPYCL